MKLKFKEILISVIFKIMLISVSILLLHSFINATDLFNKIFLGLSLMFFFFLSIFILLNPMKNYPIIKQFHSLSVHILNIIINLLIVYKIFVEPILVFIIIFAIQFILLRLVSFIFNYNIGPEILYLSLLITIIIFAYKGVYLTHYFHSKILNNKGKAHTYSNKATVRILSAINFRRRIYEIMIIMYIISSIEKLSIDFMIDNIYWQNYSKISLEILLSFVAIDGYVNTFMPKLIKRERTQYSEIKDSYTLD